MRGPSFSGEEAWTPLSLILAGPILRRVDTRSVAVWMAVSSPSSIQLHAYAGIVDSGTSAGSLASISATPIATGNALHRRLVHHERLARQRAREPARAVGDP